ncbi:TRAP transporter small permease [Chelativorans sp. SCAU2101]|jgi:TRAP-type C4-dicarboxylate transport system, small permease component|uniref:TRAP transporter small permease protein n=1 Tax=Chelativorans petroleitrophicus TaxID=2975484 RepID=A0A9X2XAG1_9HYPH|nr:TRAP transporter small permease [Chelativorans petroleitrophicus]MCT8991554.1 TRAP transporter small permease [Chelativorans petroleitrophicus]
MARVLAIVDAIEFWLIAIFSSVALLLACLAMIGRYIVPGLLLDWTFEVTIFATIWATFIAGARVAGMGEHVRVDTLLVHLPGRVRCWLAIFACLLGIATAAFLFWSGWTVVEEAFRWDERTTSSLRLPLWIYYLSLPLGMALLAFHLLVRSAQLFSGSVRDDDVAQNH